MIITVNVEKDVWDRFLIQSRSLRLSASYRINEFMRKQLRIKGLGGGEL